ncbi:MAG: YraN family protein [Terrimicrobiaceae bacterium]
MRKPSSSEAPHIRLGRQGEAIAARHLRGRGYKILRKNFRAPKGGEVDIVCRHGRELVFVEVKTRSTEEFGRPFDAVNQKKRRLIIRGAMKWLRLLEMPDITFRFDVVEVLTGPAGEVRIIENAFQLPDDYAY